MTRAEDAVRIIRVRTVGIPVTDQDQALTFYIGTLGLEKRLDVPMGGGRRWIEVAPAGAVTTVALVPAQGGASAGGETGIRFTTPDAEAGHTSLRNRGVDVDDVLRWPGVPPMFALRDPDGNGLVIVEDA